MQTKDIRLDAGQSHLAWLDKGTRIVVVGGTISVTLAQRHVDWLPDAPQRMCTMLADGECLCVESAGHATLVPAGSSAAHVAIVAPARRAAWLAAVFRRWPAPVRRRRSARS